LADLYFSSDTNPSKAQRKVPRSAPPRPSGLERLVLAIAKDESYSKEVTPKCNTTQAAHPQRAERPGFVSMAYTACIHTDSFHLQYPTRTGQVPTSETK
jgi:hypothetical protein